MNKIVKEQIELLLLDTIKKNKSIMPLFKAGYSYAKIMEWSKQIEKEGEIVYNEDGTRSLTEMGEKRWKLLKTRKKSISILPLKEYKVPKLNIDDIFLP